MEQLSNYQKKFKMATEADIEDFSYVHPKNLDVLKDKENGLINKLQVNC